MTRTRRTTAASIHDRILDAALQLASKQAWDTVSTAQIASMAKISQQELASRFATTTAIVVALIQRTDGKIKRGLKESDGTAHERLFDIMMQRYDLMQANRGAIQSVLNAAQKQPEMARALACQLHQSSRTVLRAACIPAEGLAGALRCAGLSAIWLYSLSVWRRDESRDLTETMATLDKALRQAALFAELLP